MINGNVVVDSPIPDPLVLQPKENPTVDLTNNLRVKAEVTMNLGTPVACRSYDSVGDMMVVGPANQSIELAIGVLRQSLPAGGIGVALRVGILHGLDTSVYVPGNILYVGNGVFTHIPPSSGNIQPIAQALESSTIGSILIDTHYQIPSSDIIPHGNISVSQEMTNIEVEAYKNAVKQAIIFS